jgi:hypothetical protein
VVAFKGPHINHLTPRTLDIDAIQVGMPAKGIPPKAVVEGPPPPPPDPAAPDQLQGPAGRRSRSATNKAAKAATPRALARSSNAARR